MSDLITNNDVMLTELESQIIISLATGSSKDTTALALGIPVDTIAAILRRKGVKEYLAELKAARREQMLSVAAESVFEVLQDKRAKAQEEDIRPADTTKKDTIDLSRQLVEILKSSKESVVADEDTDVFTKIYQQINILQS